MYKITVLVAAVVNQSNLKILPYRSGIMVPYAELAFFFFIPKPFQVALCNI